MNQFSLSNSKRHKGFLQSVIALALILLSLVMSTAIAQTQVAADLTQGALPKQLKSFNTGYIKAIRLSSSKESLVADGQATVTVTLELLDKDGRRVKDTHEVAVEILNARWVDAQEPVTGKTNVNVKVINGVANITLQAPVMVQDIVIKTSFEGLYERLLIKTVPALRPLIAAGVIEIRGHLNKLPAGGIVPPGDNDLFEKELTQTAWEFGNNKGSVGARAAIYLVGKVKGEYLLTVMYDSDKETRARAFRDIDPNSFYPVYGDSSYKGVEAQSTGKFFVRIDHNRSYILYGDFNAADASILQLGAYSRLATGAKYHYETDNTNANVFASYDNLKQVVDEYRAVGMSGPYLVSNPSGLLGTEQVDIITRDRMQPSIILSTTRLKRYDDYEFEPFSNRIMFKQPIASVDAMLNPIWIRVAYEVENGGERYVVMGANINSKITDKLTVSGSIVKDQNPINEYALAGIASQLKLGAFTLVTELAKSQGSQTGTLNDNTGLGIRLTGDLLLSKFSLNVSAIKTEVNFNNQAAGVAPGRQELNLKAAFKFTDSLSVVSQAVSSEDTVTLGKRESGLIGIEYSPITSLKLEAGLRTAKDTAPTNAATTSACGGFNGYQFGFGIANPGSGLGTCANGSFATSSTGSLSGSSPDLQVDSLRLKVSAKPNSASNVYLEHERDLEDSHHKLYAVGADYALDQSVRLYGRVEDLQSIALNANNSNSHTQTGMLGVSGDYMKDGQVFNEYRVNGTLNNRSTENALGLRNGFALSEGLRLTTNAEYLRVITGSASDATVFGIGLDYIKANLWKVATRIEHRRDDLTLNTLNTLSAARKINENWTLLVKNYLNLDSSRTSNESRRQSLSQMGFAYRPLHTNAYNLLGKYEYKSDNSTYLATPINDTTHTVSVHLNWHPTRVWELSQRVALMKNQTQLVTGTDSWTGWLLGSRVSYDLNERWTVGALLNYFSASGAVQSGYAVEAGYTVAPNTLFNIGYSIRGLSDKNVVSNEYRQRGLYFGLRMKFDENVFDWGIPAVNRAMPRADQSQQ